MMKGVIVVSAVVYLLCGIRSQNLAEVHYNETKCSLDENLDMLAMSSPTNLIDFENCAENILRLVCDRGEYTTNQVRRAFFALISIDFDWRQGDACEIAKIKYDTVTKLVMETELCKDSKTWLRIAEEVKALSHVSAVLSDSCCHGTMNQQNLSQTVKFENGGLNVGSRAALAMIDYWRGCNETFMQRSHGTIDLREVFDEVGEELFEPV